MKRTDLFFDRPDHLVATAPASERGFSKDNIRLMVSTSDKHHHALFGDLPHFLQKGDVLVVNRSATLAASLPASSNHGDFVLNLSTNYGNNLWVAEPRYSVAQAGPIDLQQGDIISIGTVTGTAIAPYPNIDRLWFIQFDSDIMPMVQQFGQAIRYGYVDDSYPLHHYQTVFANQVGSAEMPSAAYPFTASVVQRLQARGVQIADITLHTGVSSLEVEVDDIANHTLYPEPFTVSAATAQRINAAKAQGRRIIAVGTTVVRALESAWSNGRVQAMNGFTRLYIQPTTTIHCVDGLITGLHDPVTSHLAMLYAIAGRDMIHGAYEEAIAEQYLWHEFGDSHLILPDAEFKASVLGYRKSA